MALSATRLRDKRAKKSQRRKRMVAIKQNEELALRKGGAPAGRALVARHMRRLKDNRNHHRTKAKG